MHVARSMYPLSDRRMNSPASPLRVSRTHRISPLPPLPSTLFSSPPRDVPFSTPAYPSAGRCVQFADVKCNIRLSPPSWSPTRALSPTASPPRESPADPPRATICVQSMHLVRLRTFIARAHALYRLVSIMSAGGGGRGRWGRGRRGGRWTAEKRVTMRTCRHKIGRHACMRIRARVHRPVGRAEPANVQVPCE